MGLSLTDELDKLIYDFGSKHGLTGTDFHTHVAHVEMKKKKVQIVDDFAEKTKRVIRWDELDPNDLRTQIKQCPGCYQFLVKTEGCDGSTQCGNLPRNYYDVPKERNPWYKHVVKRVEGKLHLTKYASQYFLPKKTSGGDRAFFKTQLKPGAQLDLAGCGREFEWKYLAICHGGT